MVGTSDVMVTLSWDDMSCGFTSMTDLRMAVWDGSEWKNEGNGGTSGTTSEGTMLSNGESSIFGTYTLGTVDEFTCVPCRAEAGEDMITFDQYPVEIGGPTGLGLTYLWSPSAGLDDNTISDPHALPASAQTYHVKVTNASGCSATDVVFLTIFPTPTMHNCLGGH
jgi:hypothetical protein